MPVNGYRVKRYDQPVKRYCQTIDLSDNLCIRDSYKECHSKANAWPEIREGIREVGILEMEMYITGNRVFMIVETPLDFDWDTAMKRLATLPRQAEWENFVATFQGCNPDSTSAEKWTLMERMFYLYEN